jgi:predicted Fe-S protein YdhL (DUF1289 family)
MEQTSFLEAPKTAGAASAWMTLDEEERAEILATLARLIAKVFVAQSDEAAHDSEGATDE